MDPKWARNLCTDVKVVIYDKSGEMAGGIQKSVDMDCYNRVMGKKK